MLFRSAAIARYRWVDHLRKVYRADETELPAEISVDPQAEEVVAKVSIDRLLGHLPDRQASAIRLVKIDGLKVRGGRTACDALVLELKQYVRAYLTSRKGTVPV